MELNRALDEARTASAQSDYAGALANVRAQKDEAKEAVQPYNEAITGILEPLGTAGLHPIAKKLFKRAVQKGAKTVVRAGRTAVSDLADGTNPLARVPSLDEVRGNISGVTDDIGNNLSERGQSILNGARRLTGRSPLTQSAPEPPAPSSAPTPPEPPSGSNVVPQTAEEGNLAPQASQEPKLVNLADEGPVENEDLVDAVASGRMDISQALFKHQMRSGDVPTAKALREGQPSSPQAQQQRFKNRLNDLDNEPSGSDSAEASQPASDGSPPAPNEPQADTSTASTDPAPAPAEPPAPPPATEESALLTDAGEAELGGGGPEDPFADIVAGVLSLGAIIAGATAKVKPASVTGNLVNPSVQYGI